MSANPYEPATFVKIEHPDWSKNATIYQINLRQFTAEGTLRATSPICRVSRIWAPTFSG